MLIELTPEMTGNETKGIQNSNNSYLASSTGLGLEPREVTAEDGAEPTIVVNETLIGNTIAIKPLRNITATNKISLTVKDSVKASLISPTGEASSYIRSLNRNVVYYLTFIKFGNDFRWVCTNYRDDLGVIGHNLFTPTLTAPSGSATYHHNEGECFKIGKLITTFFSIYIKSSTLSSDPVFISGFPFPRGGLRTFDVEEPISIYGVTNVTDSGFSAFLRAGNNTDSFRLGYTYKSGSNNIGVANLSGNQIKADTVIRGKISYITD